MDKKRRKESQGWSEREGEGFIQRSESRKARIESSAARRRFPPRFILRENDGYEEEADLQEDRERSEQQD
jgi:hypothetical protein